LQATFLPQQILLAEDSLSPTEGTRRLKTVEFRPRDRPNYVSIREGNNCQDFRLIKNLTV